MRFGLSKWKINIIAFLIVALLFSAVWTAENFILYGGSIVAGRSYELIKDIFGAGVTVLLFVNVLLWFREKAEKDIFRKEKYLADIVNTSADAILGVDMSGKIQSWNMGAESIFGYSTDKVIGKEFRTLFAETEMNGVYFSRVNEMLKVKGSVKNYDAEMLRSDRRKIFVNLSCSVLKDMSGREMGISVIIKDVTEKKLMAERMQQSEKLIAIGQLAAGIAHEVFTPLNVISGNAEYLQMGMEKNNPMNVELKTIIGETERITKLIQRLMDYARPQKLEFKEINVNRMIMNMLEFVKSQLLKAGVDIVTDLDHDLPFIMADENQIEQAFLNIIINAWQAMPKGGKLTLATSALRLDAAQTEHIQIKIADTGCGIESDNLKRIFDPFFSTKDVGKGTGLGLTISYRIIEDHGGSIKVESVVNSGTTVTVVLPLQS